MARGTDGYQSRRSLVPGGPRSPPAPGSDTARPGVPARDLTSAMRGPRARPSRWPSIMAPAASGSTPSRPASSRPRCTRRKATTASAASFPRSGRSARSATSSTASCSWSHRHTSPASSAGPCPATRTEPVPARACHRIPTRPPLPARTVPGSPRFHGCNALLKRIIRVSHPLNVAARPRHLAGTGTGGMRRFW